MGKIRPALYQQLNSAQDFTHSILQFICSAMPRQGTMPSVPGATFLLPELEGGNGPKQIRWKRAMFKSTTETKADANSGAAMRKAIRTRVTMRDTRAKVRRHTGFEIPEAN